MTRRSRQERNLLREPSLVSNALLRYALTSDVAMVVNSTVAVVSESPYGKVDDDLTSEEDD